MEFDFQLINKILIGVINITGFWLVFWVYFSDRKKTINKGFASLIIPNLLWVDSYILASLINEYNLSLLFIRLTFAFTAIFFISFYYYFIIWFLKEGGRYVFVGKIVLIYEVIFSFFCAFTDLILSRVESGKYGVIPIFSNIGKITFYLPVIILVIIVIGRLLSQYLKSPQNIKIKIQYFLIGVCVFTISNLIIGVIFPTFFNAHDYYFITSYSTFIFLAFTAYAIVKQELMGIKTLLTQVLIVLISIILLIDILFLSNDSTMQLLKLGILLAFLYFSREMVKSARKEKEAREELEVINKHLKEKTQDLVALLSLNEMISVGGEIEKSVQSIMDAVPEKLGHLGIMGTFLIRYDEKNNRVYAYVTTESEHVRQAKKILTKPKLTDYSLKISTRKNKKYGLIVKSILENEIQKGENLADFVSPPLSKPKALAMQEVLGGKTFVSVPMTIRGKIKGALVFMFIKNTEEVSPRDLDLIKAFTQHVSVVLDNLHFYHNLNRNIDELTRAKDKLKETLSMKNDFLHIVSHQLRTPLTAMRGFISMWNEGDFDTLPKNRMEEIKSRIVNNSERLNNIVNDMVTAMESEGELKVRFKTVDLKQLLSGNIEMLKPSFEKKELYLRYKETEADIPNIEADEKLLLNVFMNLIDNAEKYTDKGGLTIAVGRDGDYAKIDFIDTGVGLSKEDKKILFKKFSRGAKSNYINPNGSGLGLFIIKQIIRRHHGDIKAYSSGEGKGSTFTVTLPIKQGK